jgi:hypothetical protein
MIEGLSLEIAEYRLANQISSEQIEILSEAFAAIDGVENAKIGDDSVSIHYYPDILSRESMRRELVRLGVSLEKNEKPRNPFKRFVNRLAESNTKAFGSEPLDCCKLNSKPQNKA